MLERDSGRENNSSKTFEELYQAYFELEAPEDPLSAGLVIRVKPPGKKMTQLGLVTISKDDTRGHIEPNFGILESLRYRV